MLMVLVAMLAAYLIGSTPMGFIFVKVFSGRDIRQVGSGRTGGTNAMRAAGYGAGLLTALFDALKGATGVWLAKAIVPGDWQVWAMTLAGLCAILGHNYSIYLKFKGGAGGGPCVGAAIAIWPWSAAIIIPIGAVVFFGIGYASITTLSIGVIVTALFTYRYITHRPGAEAEFIFYGIGSTILLVWALRPNIKRLLRGEEPGVSWRAKRMKQAQAASGSGEGGGNGEG